VRLSTGHALVHTEEVTSPVNLGGALSVISECDVNRTIIIAPGVLTASILLTACGGSPPTDTTNSYTSAEQVVTALAKGGLPCTGAQYGTPVVKDASSETLCNFSSNDQALIDVFPASHTVTESEVSANSVSTGSQQIITVYGPNWWVQTDSTYDEQVQKILAGKVLAGPWHPSSSSQSSSPSTTDPAITVCQDFADIESTLTADLNTVEANPSAGATGPNSITPLGNTLNKYGDDMSHWSYVVNQAVDNGTTSASVALANDLGDAGIATVQAGVAGETDPGAASSALSNVQSVQSDCSGL
jgi:hypothetical protein